MIRVTRAFCIRTGSSTDVQMLGSRKRSPTTARTVPDAPAAKRAEASRHAAAVLSVPSHVGMATPCSSTNISSVLPPTVRATSAARSAPPIVPVRPDQKKAVSGAVTNGFAVPPEVDVAFVCKRMSHHRTIVATAARAVCGATTTP